MKEGKSTCTETAEVQPQKFSLKHGKEKQWNNKQARVP